MKLRISVIFCIVAACAAGLVGCKQDEKSSAAPDQTASALPATPEPAVITGQIFLVTTDRQNVVLGDEKIALVNVDEARKYFNSKAAEWSNTMAVAQANLDRAASNYHALYREGLDKYAAAKKIHEHTMATADPGSQAWQDASAWSAKLADKIKALHQLKLESDARQQDAEAKQAQAWELINWPAAAYFYPSLDTTTSDSEGRFKFSVANPVGNLAVMAKASHKINGETENAWWLESFFFKGQKAEIILSNENENGLGVWYYFEKPMQDFFMQYHKIMESGAEDRKHADFEESLGNPGDGS